MKQPHHRRSLIAVYLTSFAQGALGVILPASSSILRQRLSLGDTTYGALFLPGLGLAVVTSLAGHLCLRRWSLKSLFHFALFSQVLALGLMAWSGQFRRPVGLPVLFLAMAVSGPAGGLMGITLNTAAIELYPRARSSALSAMHGILGAGATLGPMLVAGWSALGLWAAAPLTVAGVLALLALATWKRPVIGLAEDLQEAHGRFTLPVRLWFRCSTALLYGVCEATFTAWAVVFLRENRGLTLAVAAGALSAFWVAMTAGRLLGAWAVGKVGLRPLIYSLSIGVSIAFVLVAHCHGAADSLVRFAFAGLACSALFPLLLGLASQEVPESTPQISAVFSALAGIGLGLGCFAIGPLRGRIGLERVYWISIAWPLLLIATVYLMDRRYRRDRAA